MAKNITRKVKIPSSQIFYFGYDKKNKTYFFKKADGNKADRSIKLLENNDKTNFITDRLKNPKDTYTFNSIKIEFLGNIKPATTNRLNVAKYFEFEKITRNIDGTYTPENKNKTNELVTETIDCLTSTIQNKKLLEAVRDCLFPFISLEIREQDDLLLKKDLKSLMKDDKINLTQSVNETFEFKLEIDSYINDMPIDTIFIDDLFTSNTIETTIPAVGEAEETQELLQVSCNKMIAYGIDDDQLVVFPIRIYVDGELSTIKGTVK